MFNIFLQNFSQNIVILNLYQDLKITVTDAETSSAGRLDGRLFHIVLVCNEDEK